MSRIEDRDDYNSIANILKEENRRLPPPTASKNFNSMVQSKQRENSAEKKEANEIEEEVEVEFEGQQTRSVELKARQAKALNSLLTQKKEEESVKSKEMAESEENKTESAEKETVNQETKKDSNKSDFKNSLLEKIDKAEDMTVELSPEEIKNLQELLQKDTKDKTPFKKELLTLLDTALQSGQDKINKKTEKPLFSSPLQAENSTKQLNKAQNKNPALINKEEALQSSTQGVKNSEDAQKILQKKNTENEALLNPSAPDKEAQLADRSVADKKLHESNQIDVKTLKEQTNLENAAAKKDSLLETEKTAALVKDTAITSAKSDQQILQERTVKENSQLANKDTLKTSLQDKSEQVDKDEAILKEATYSSTDQLAKGTTVNLQNTNDKNYLAENLVNTQVQVPIENRLSGNILNDRFSSKKEISGEIRQGTQPNTASQQKAFEAIKSTQDKDSTDSAAEKNKTVEEKAGKPKDARIKGKSLEERSVEAETSSATSIAPTAKGLEGTAQLQPERQEVSKESISQLIKELVDQILVIKTQGQTDTILTLRSPKLLEGSTIKISTYDQARGEINISFANLTPQAKKILDSKLAKESLVDNLKTRSNVIVHNIITTTQAETPNISKKKEVPNKKKDVEQISEEE